MRIFTPGAVAVSADGHGWQTGLRDRIVPVLATGPPDFLPMGVFPWAAARYRILPATLRASARASECKKVLPSVVIWPKPAAP